VTFAAVPGARTRARCLIGFLALALPTSAQVIHIDSEVLQTLPPGIVLPDGIPADSVQPAEAAEPATPEARQLQELLGLKFNRSVPAILDALASQIEGNTPTNEIERFQQFVIAADWPAVGTFLSGLTNDHGQQVYRHLLRELPNASRAAGGRPAPGQPMMMPNQPGPANTPGLALVPNDLLSLADIAPHDLEAEDARLLGELLGRLLNRGDALDPFLSKLERGVRRLGGTNPEDRRRAAELLVAADRIVEAGVFLPSLGSARETHDWESLDLHARQLLALARKDKDADLFTAAWAVNQFILGSSDVTVSNRAPALSRAFELMPLIAREVGGDWLRRSFQSKPGEGLAILSAMGQMVQQGLTSPAIEQRQKNLQLQKQVVESFLEVADPAQPHWRTALTLLAEGWLQEATYAGQHHQSRRQRGAQFDPYGNVIYYEPPQAMFHGGNQLPPIPAEQVLKCAPGEAWLLQIDESFRLALFSLIADLQLKAEQLDEALSMIERLAPYQPPKAADLANDFLRAWAESRTPVQQPTGPRYMVGGQVFFPGNPGMPGTGTSLTRAMQVRNVKELSNHLRRLQALSLPKIDVDAIVGAFTAAHSPAEVFRADDIASVFGSSDELPLDILARLTQTMRERLATQWRQSRVQQQAKTRRTDQQIESEVLRGYEVVLNLIADGLKRDPNHWPLTLARAATCFDLAEFQYGKKVDLAVYVEKREEAFNGFENAAQLYAASLPNTEEKDESPQVYQQWFNANLGASDLAYVTRQQEPETNQLQRIRNAILALPDAAAERHLSAFASSLTESLNTLRPELKPRYVRASLRIIGHHADADDIRTLATYYDDLLNEIEFVVRLDGDATVGHTRAFGAFVALRHTAEIEREAGGFGRYLRGQTSSPYYYGNPYAQQQRNFIDDFDKQVREKLIDHFEIKSITFLDEKVESRGYGRSGWRETPLAYLLLQAKDGSVDRLPALQMDLDFTDSRGPAVLPVESQVTLIDARPERTGPRPVTDLEVTQILDDRDSVTGALTLEIKAVGKGLVPELAELIRTNFTGLFVDEVSDQGLAIAQIDTDGENLASKSERNWLLKLRVPEDAPASLAFRFPEAAREDVKLLYKRYADADLAEVEPRLALAGLTLRPKPIWHWMLALAGLITACVGAWWWTRQHQPAPPTSNATYNLPGQITPFSVIGLLQRMASDTSLRWSEPDREELHRAVLNLERHFFNRGTDEEPAPDLITIGHDWIDRANQGRI
jgi:hypothetical protein